MLIEWINNAGCDRRQRKMIHIGIACVELRDISTKRRVSAATVMNWLPLAKYLWITRILYCIFLSRCRCWHLFQTIHFIKARLIRIYKLVFVSYTSVAWQRKRCRHYKNSYITGSLIIEPLNIKYNININKYNNIINFY